MRFRPLVLTVLDGWGCRDAGYGNAIAAANAPHWRAFFDRYPWTTLDASGTAVGLPPGIMGNSEVGHMNLGAGRVVPQGLLVIDAALASGAFAGNPVLREAIDHVQRTGGRLHFLGLLSDGCVHSSIEHLFALLDAAVAGGVPLAVHAFLDGRDTPPRSAQRYVRRLEEHLAAVGRAGSVASVTGRYYAMDRDSRWERTERAYDAIAWGRAPFAVTTAAAAVDAGYARGQDDEFVEPTIVGTPRPVAAGDACIFFNFRPDRARQLTTAFDAGVPAYRTQPFGAFAPRAYDDLIFATMTKYDEAYRNPVLFGPRPQADTFGEVLARAGLRQLRLAETEKYAHVTYFFNGGREERFGGEDRRPDSIRIVRSRPTISRRRCGRTKLPTPRSPPIESGKYDAIVMNYANADMVGHTGKWAPTVSAVEVLDSCLERLSRAVLAAGGLFAITADHGNAEEMLDPAAGRLPPTRPTSTAPADWCGLDGTLGARREVRRRRSNAAGALGFVRARTHERHQSLRSLSRRHGSVQTAIRLM